MSKGTRTRSLRVGDEWARVEAAALDSDMTPSEVIRKLIKEHLPAVTYCAWCDKWFRTESALATHRDKTNCAERA